MFISHIPFTLKISEDMPQLKKKKSRITVCGVQRIVLLIQTPDGSGKNGQDDNRTARLEGSQGRLEIGDGGLQENRDLTKKTGMGEN